VQVAEGPLEQHTVLQAVVVLEPLGCAEKGVLRGGRKGCIPKKGGIAGLPLSSAKERKLSSPHRLVSRRYGSEPGTYTRLPLGEELVEEEPRNIGSLAHGMSLGSTSHEGPSR
jgi:hypothetical protein